MTSLPSIANPETAGAELDEFAALETRIQSVAEALKLARAERDAARAEIEPLQTAHQKLQQAHALAERELTALRKERNEIRQRVARLVTQVEAAVS